MQEDIVKIISKHIKHTDSAQEKETLLHWLEESEENRRFYSVFVANYSLHDAVSSDRLGADMDTMLSRLGARIEASDAAAARRRFSWPFAAAAVAVVAALLFFFVPRRDAASIPAEPPMTLLTNITDNTVHMELEDGTRVFLCPGAKISYNVAGIADSRIVDLEGDAYFDVAKDEMRPFTVKTESIAVRVLGTAFSVSSSAEVSQVVLERGSVRLFSPQGFPLLTLSPNQKATFMNVTSDLKVEQVYAKAFVTDKYNMFSMTDAKLTEIISAISEMFKVRISCSGGDREKQYNIAFLKTDSIQDVLAIVSYMSGADCKVSNK